MSKHFVIGKLFLMTLIACLLACLAGVASAQPSISSVSPSVQDRSGFLEILGSGFGTDGRVLVDNLPAVTTTWTDTRIAAYVPEGSNLGPVHVVVESSSTLSNVGSVNVTLRQQVGRVKWRLRMDAPYSAVRPARGADGTIFVVDVFARLYAVSPNGELRWVALGAGDKGVSVGTDGTIYTGSENDVKAFNADGSLKWTFVQNPRAFIFLGLAVGPDGNIYAASSEGMGVFSLRPDGSLRWATPERYNRPIVTYEEIAFGPGPGGQPQMYFSANAHTRAVRLSDGAHMFYALSGSIKTSPFDGTLHYPNMAINPDGSLYWQFSEFLSAGPALAPNGNHYAATPMSTPRLYALSPTGSQRWQVVLSHSPGQVDVDPTDSTIVVGGYNTLNYPGLMSAYSTNQGGKLWQLGLPTEEPQIPNGATGGCGFNHFIDSGAAFTPLGETFYIMTAIAPGGAIADRGFLYAIDTNPAIALTSTLLRSSAVTITRTTKRGVITAVNGQVSVEDENQLAVNGVVISATWTLPNGSTVNQVYDPSATGKKGAGGGVQFSVPYSGMGTYKLTVTNLSRLGYTFDGCNGVLSQSVYF